MSRSTLFANHLLQENSSEVARIDSVGSTVDVILAADTTTITRFDFVSFGGDFLWTGALSEAAGAGGLAGNNFRIRMRADWEGSYLDTDQVDAQSFFWPQATQDPLLGRHPPKLIPGNSRLVFEIVNTAASATTARLYLLGRKATPEDKKRWGGLRGLFVVSMPFAGLTVGASQKSQFNLQLPNDWNFRICQIGGKSTGAYLGNFTYTDAFTGEEKAISNKKMHNTNFTGAYGAGPTGLFVPPGSIVCKKGTTIDFDFFDLSNAANSITIALIGERVPDEDLVAFGSGVCT